MVKRESHHCEAFIEIFKTNVQTLGLYLMWGTCTIKLQSFGGYEAYRSASTLFLEKAVTSV